MSDLTRRHHTERPLRQLTELELHVLDQLSRLSNVLRTDYADVISDLGALAAYEDGERQLRSELDTQRVSAQNDPRGEADR